MSGLKAELEREQKFLAKIIDHIEAELPGLPEGSLRATVINNKPRFYHCTIPGDYIGKYINKKNSDIIGQLAQRHYDEKVLRLAKHRMKQILPLLHEYTESEFEALYTDEPTIKQKYIKPIIMPWKMQKEKWLAEPYIGKGIDSNSVYYETKNGERVRSKSEKIIADLLYDNGIPYKYECPLRLNGLVIYPDFTILSRKTRGIIFWEHEGMLDNQDYLRKAIRKRRTYEKNGIFVGEKLIISQEANGEGLSIEEIKLLIEKYC